MALAQGNIIPKVKIPKVGPTMIPRNEDVTYKGKNIIFDTESILSNQVIVRLLIDFANVLVECFPYFELQKQSSRTKVQVKMY